MANCTTENVLPNDNVSMSVGHLDHVLIVYRLMEHVTWKSPGPMCGWVGRILHPDSCTSVSSWSKVPILSIWYVAVPLCRPLLPCPSRWHGSLPRHGLWWLTCELHGSPLPWRLGSVYQLWKSPLLSCVPWSSDRTSCLSLQHKSWFPRHVLHQAVNNQDVIKKSDGHRNVVISNTFSVVIIIIRLLSISCQKRNLTCDRE